MIIKVFSIDKIVPYSKNAKEHPKEQIEQIKRSIEEFGFNDPIAIDENNVIIEGHGRLLAIKELGYKEVECIQLTHLTEAQKKAYIIAHNKLTLNTGFDMDTLLDELKELELDGLDTSLTGFNTDELAELFHEEKEVVDDDFDTTPPEVAKSKLGDLWILGRHRLLCGDSTIKEDVDVLVNEKLVDMIFTDPPYNVDYEGTAGKIQNDKMEDSAFYTFLFSAFTNMFENTKKGGAIYVCHADTEGLNFRNAYKNAGFKLAECLIWVKNALVLGRQDYHWRHEPILYGWKEGAAHYFVDDRSQDTIWEYNKPRKNEEHPTMKPLELVGKAIANSSRVGEVVLDLFGGSGSTLIASEQLNRICYMMELDEKYIDVIVNRYYAFTHDENIKLIRDGVDFTFAQIMDGE